MWIFENSVSISKEVIDNHGVLLVASGTVSYFLAIWFDQREYLSWNAFIVDVYLIFSLGFTHVLGWSIVGACSSGHLLSLQKSAWIFADEFGFLFAQVKECASAGTLSNSLISLGFFGCCSHHGVVVFNSGWKTWIYDFLGATQTIDESLLLLNLILL